MPGTRCSSCYCYDYSAPSVIFTIDFSCILARLSVDRSIGRIFWLCVVSWLMEMMAKSTSSRSSAIDGKTSAFRYACFLSCSSNHCYSIDI